MPLTGTYLRTLDEKRRIAVPKRLRDDFAAENLAALFVAPGTDRSLLLYTPEAFEELGRRMAARTVNAANQNYLRLFYSSAERLDFDSQSRIRVPDRLAEYAGLKHDVYLLGVQDHAELWDKETWDRFVSQQTPVFDQLAFQTLE